MAANFLTGREHKYDWSEILVQRLHEASILYPKESLFRMKRIANYVGSNVTDKQCSRKMNLLRQSSLIIIANNFNFEPAFPSHEKYPFGPDGIPIGFRYKYNSNSKWTKDMDDKLREAEKLFPPGSSGSIKKITKFVGGGITEKQVHHRRNYLFAPPKPHVATIKMHWTCEMDKKLVRAVQQFNDIQSKKGIHWPSVNKIMNLHNDQSENRWRRIKQYYSKAADRVNKTNNASGTGVVNVGACRRNGTCSSTVTEAEDYLSESDYWVDVSDPATAKRLNRRKRNRNLFLSMWNSGGDSDNSVVFVVHSSDSSYCIDISDGSVCSDDLHSVSDVDCYDGSSGTGSSYPVKRQRCDDDIVLDDKNSDVDFENYVTITDELIDMLGLYDSSSGESDCD